MKPYERYTEVFIDEGENNMFAVMKELVRQKYTRLIYPEHPRGIDYDRERPNSAAISRRRRICRLSRSTWATRAPCCRPRYHR